MKKMVKKSGVETIVYSSGGLSYHGVHPEKTAQKWREWGREKGYGSYMYKGFRNSGNKRSQVVVFDTVSWSPPEIARRRANGFLGIRTYRLK